MRWVLTCFFVMSCWYTLAGCGKDAGAAKPALVVGVCDPLCGETASPCIRASAKRDYRGFARAVKERADIELDLKFYGLDEQLAQAVQKGEVNAAIAKTWTVLSASKGRVFERLADVPRQDGVNEVSGVFITRTDSALTTIQELDGKTVVLGPDLGYEKSHAARRALSDAGVKPGSVRILDPCVAVASAVFEKQADAGVVSSYVVDFGGLRLVSDPKDFKVIGKTKPVPFITFAVSAEVDPAVREKLKRVLLEMAGPGVPEGLYTSGLVAAKPWAPEELEKK
jgi:ABC-type phosphate/phosphonate transport system substrate-binding protein